MLEQKGSGIFDVSDLNFALNRAKQRDNAVSAGAAVFCLAVVALLLGLDLSRALRGQLPAFGVFVFVVAIVWLLAITGALLWGIRRKRPGASSVLVNAEGMTLDVPSRTTLHILWSDPRLQVELHDLSRVDPRVLSVRTPYFLKIKGVHSAISKQAFEAILGQANDHGLVDQVRRASRWLSPANATVHVIANRQAS